MGDGALTPPELELMVIGVAGGSAGSGAPTSVSVRTPATFVNGPAPSGFGSNRTPVVVRYGFSVRVAFASDEAFFNSILANATALRIEVDDNLRYLRLDDADWAHPTTLTSDDATRVLGSGKHFARKLDLDVDERLFDLIDASVDERRQRRLTSA